MKLVTVDLKSIIEDYGVERTRLVLSKFMCPSNPEVQDFISNRAIDHERRRLARTRLIIDEDAGYQIVGFYSLAIKSFVLSGKLSTSQKKKFFGTSQTNGDVIPAILIGQLGKNDNVTSEFTGSDLMDLIFRDICQMDTFIPSIVAYVEHNGSDCLVKYYEKHGFMYFKREKEEQESGLYCHIIKTKDIIQSIDN